MREPPFAAKVLGALLAGGFLVFFALGRLLRKAVGF